MFFPFRRLLVFLPLLLVATGLVAQGRTRARHSERSSASDEINPAAYHSAILVDAATGKVLFEDRADVQSPPASVTKLMTFDIIADKIKRGELTLETPVTITREAARMGGSEAWLMDKEVVPVDKLLYLLMVPSANDAAMALAIQAAGSEEAFVDLMNAKARELGMTHTAYYSPHGLPPGKGQHANLSTARDIALLCRDLLAHTDVLRYSSTRHFEFRHANGKTNEFYNHDHLLASLPGCDGLKTGWYAKAGYSIAVTVQRNNRRLIAVVLGSPERKLRDTVITRLVERGFAALPPAAVSSPPAAAATPAPVAPPAGAPTTTAAAPSAPPPAETSSLKPVPFKPGEKPFDDGSNSGPSVHIDLPSAK